MKLISQDVKSLVRKILKNHHPIFAEILINWDKIVGSKFCNKTKPLKILSVREKGQKISILQIVADNPSVALEISYYQDIIIERIAVYLGFNGISKLRIVLQTSS